MTVLRYSFRPSLFERERTIVLDDQGVTSEYGGTSFRTPWSKIAEVHIEPVPAGEDDKSRWLVNLRTNGGAVIKIDSVNVRGTADFEHKTEEFVAVLKAIHAALATRQPPVRFRFGTRAGIIVAWRVALVLTLAAGIFGIAVAIATEDYEALLYVGPFAAFGLLGLLSLRGKRGPKPYDPSGFIDGLSKS
ncbi:hypothetical protein BH10PSE9_BH10PSE9_06410 [soil metagenome]